MKKYIGILAIMLGIFGIIFADITFAEQQTEAPARDDARLHRVLGDPSAPITIEEYASMTCPHCAHFHRDTLPELKKQYIETGKVQYILHDFPFDSLSLRAAVVARCAPESSYYPLISTIFANQEQWARAKDPATALNNMAKLVGVTDDQINACLNDKNMIKKIGEIQLQAQKQYGISSTPSFLINGEKITGAKSVQEFKKIIDRLLTKGDH